MDDTRLEPYYFHERDFDSVEEAAEWFEWEIPEQFNIAEHVCDRWAEQDGNKVALYLKDPAGGQTAYSFRQLQHDANRFANFLADQGVGRGDRVVVNGKQRAQSLIAHLAVFKLGAVSVPVSVLLGTDGLRYRLDDCEATAFVVDEDAVETLRAVRDDVDSLELTVTMEGFDRGNEVAFEDALAGQSPSFETVETAPDDAAFIIYTSGTTGQPKGAIHGHQHLLGELPQYLSLQAHETGREQVTRTISEWSWIMSLPGMVLPALFYGVTVAGYPSSGFEPETEFEIVQQFGVTHLNLPPTAVRMMMQVEDPAERFDLSSLQSFSTGGESAGTTIIEWVEETFENAAFIEGYGTTELGGVICDDPALAGAHRLGYFGIPSIGHEFRVLDRETGEPIEEPGEIGELAMRYEDDPAAFMEYLGKPEQTNETKVDGWVHTSDLVSFDEDGYYRFHSRDDDLIVSSGYRIAPREIEEALDVHESVQNVGVIGVPHDTRGEVPKAFVVLQDGYEPSGDLKEALQSHVKERLAKYEYPRELEFVDDLPQTTTGKIRRTSLREREGIDGE